MSRTLALLAAASILVLGGCASTPTADALRSADAPVEGRPDGSAYGAFLAGQAARNAGQHREATAYFSQSARASGNAEVRENAFYSAVLAGDMARAKALNPEVATASPGAARLGRLVTAVEAMAEGQGRKAYAALSGEPVGFPHRAAAALLKPWAAAAAGDIDAATVEPELKSDRLAYALGSLSRAQLLERAKRYKEAEDVLKAMSSEDAMGSIFLEAHGQFLERRGRQADAIALYDSALAKSPNDASLIAARARAAAKGAPEALPALREGGAEALVGAAASATLLKQSDLTLVYLRLALRLDPKSDEAWMMLGDTLLATQDADAAREAYARVKVGSPIFVQARTRTVWSYQSEKERPQALTVARETVQQVPDSTLAKTTLADVLRASKQYDESAKVMDAVISAEGKDADWRLYYLRALALDKAGRWGEAERDLKAALVLKPDEAEILNYLGYTWITRGERLDEALAMVRKAVDAEPNSGAVVDSLGWAYYSLGQYGEAVTQLERASQLEPDDPEINTHLGDAYWRIGRRVEARFQWQKVLGVMKPEPELKAGLEERLKVGLGPAPKPPAGAPKVAAR